MYAKQKASRKLIVSAAVILLLVGSLGAFALLRSETPETTPSGVTLAPATPEERKSSEDNKARIVEEEKQRSNSGDSSQSASSKRQVSVTVTSATAESVNAYVTGVFEEGGTCTATFTQGSTTISRTSVGFGNVSYTQCAPIAPSLPSTSGWSVKVNYSSAAAEGTSQAYSF